MTNDSDTRGREWVRERISDYFSALLSVPEIQETKLYQNPWFVVVDATAPQISGGSGGEDLGSEENSIALPPVQAADGAVFFRFLGLVGEENDDLWDELITQIIRKRPRRPVNGLILCLNAEELGRSSGFPSEVFETAIYRCQTIMKRLKQTVPFFIAVANLKRIPGGAYLYEKRPNSSSPVNVIFSDERGEPDSPFFAEEVQRLFFHEFSFEHRDGENAVELPEALDKIGERLRAWQLGAMANADDIEVKQKLLMLLPVYANMQMNIVNHVTSLLVDDELRKKMILRKIFFVGEKNCFGRKGSLLEKEVIADRHLSTEQTPFQDFVLFGAAAFFFVFSFFLSVFIAVDQTTVSHSEIESALEICAKVGPVTPMVEREPKLQDCGQHVGTLVQRLEKQWWGGWLSNNWASETADQLKAHFAHAVERSYLTPKLALAELKISENRSDIEDYKELIVMANGLDFKDGILKNPKKILRIYGGWRKKRAEGWIGEIKGLVSFYWSKKNITAKDLIHLAANDRKAIDAADYWNYRFSPAESTGRKVSGGLFEPAWRETIVPLMHHTSILVPEMKNEVEGVLREYLEVHRQVWLDFFRFAMKKRLSEKMPILKALAYYRQTYDKLRGDFLEHFVGVQCSLGDIRKSGVLNLESGIKCLTDTAASLENNSGSVYSKKSRLDSFSEEIIGDLGQLIRTLGDDSEGIYSIMSVLGRGGPYSGIYGKIAEIQELRTANLQEGHLTETELMAAEFSILAVDRLLDLLVGELGWRLQKQWEKDVISPVDGLDLKVKQRRLFGERGAVMSFSDSFLEREAGAGYFGDFVFVGRKIELDPEILDVINKLSNGEEMTGEKELKKKLVFGVRFD